MRPIDADAMGERTKELVSRCMKMQWAGADLYVKYLRIVKGMIDSAPTIEQPPNDPLTPEQLRYMSGEPIWITGERFHPRWDLIRRVSTSGISTYTLGFLSWEDCLKTWFARRRPEEVTQ